MGVALVMKRIRIPAKEKQGNVVFAVHFRFTVKSAVYTNKTECISKVDM